MSDSLEKRIMEAGVRPSELAVIVVPLTAGEIRSFLKEGHDIVDIAHKKAKEQIDRSGSRIPKDLRLKSELTPVVSFHPMRHKWKQWGKWWTRVTPDGQSTFVNHVGTIEPKVIQLFYIRRDDGLVEQLAWERPDLYWNTIPLHIVGEAQILTVNDDR